MSERTCKTCQWWHSWMDERVVGFCQVIPPIPDPDARADDFDTIRMGVFPLTYDTTYCGCHQPLDSQ